MISLSRPQRAALLFVSASAYLAWFSGFGDRIDAQGLAQQPTPSLTLVPRAQPPRVATIILRDPFAGAPVPQGPAGEDSGTGPAARGGNDTVPITTPDDRMLASVPDIGSSNEATTLVVRATIAGRNPVAYVANGSMMDIVRVGDRLGDRRIGSIDIRGIAFTDGSRLDLPGAFVATPAPASARGSSAITIKVDDLRKLLARPATSVSPPPKTTLDSRGSQVPYLAITPAPVGTFPTPGPLPTVDQRGIPAGSNPTPNADGPTPYPNPYPYAPPHR